MQHLCCRCAVKFGHRRITIFMQFIVFRMQWIQKIWDAGMLTALNWYGIQSSGGIL